ncbi:MAG: hypothetical protein R3A47_05425 [Polyangiales bacterium]
MNADAACVGDTCVLQQGEGVCVADGDCEGALTCNAGLCEAGIATGATGCQRGEYVLRECGCGMRRRHVRVATRRGRLRGRRRLRRRAHVRRAFYPKRRSSEAVRGSIEITAWIATRLVLGTRVFSGSEKPVVSMTTVAQGASAATAKESAVQTMRVCADNADCVNTCIGGTCAPIASNGEVCDTDDDADCESDSVLILRARLVSTMRSRR